MTKTWEAKVGYRRSADNAQVTITRGQFLSRQVARTAANEAVKLIVERGSQVAYISITKEVGR